MEVPDTEGAAALTDPPAIAPPLPNLGQLHGNVRWWADIVGFTNPLDNNENQNILSPNVSRTIIANLQQQTESERTSLIQALLSFVGLLIAELMKDR